MEKCDFPLLYNLFFYSNQPQKYPTSNLLSSLIHLLLIFICYNSEA